MARWENGMSTEVVVKGEEGMWSEVGKLPKVVDTWRWAW